MGKMVRYGIDDSLVVLFARCTSGEIGDLARLEYT